MRSQSKIEQELARLHDLMLSKINGSNHDALYGAAQALSWALGRPAPSPCAADEIIRDYKRRQEEEDHRAPGADAGRG